MPSPRTLLSAHDLRPRKQLGQNFLAHPGTARMIVERARIGADDRVLEIGPGLGALTIPLAEVAGAVVAVEKDRGLVPVLRQTLLAAGFERVVVREADILECDLAAIAREAGGGALMVASTSTPRSSWRDCGCPSRCGPRSTSSDRCRSSRRT